MRTDQKLYVVTRRDLSPGAQAVQGMHALVEFQFEHPESADEWHSISNTLGFLSVADEKELNELCGLLFSLGIRHAMFREPDMGMSLTAIAIEATDQAMESVRPLKVALRELAPMGHQQGQRPLNSRSSGQHRVGALKWTLHQRIKQLLGFD